MSRLVIFKRTFASKKGSTLAYGTGLSLFTLAYSAMFNTFAKQIDDLVQGFPEGVSSVFGDIAQASTPEGWLSIELFSLIAPLVLSILAISFGAAALGKDEDSGVLELTLASPISRTKVWWQKVAAVFVQNILVAGAMFSFIVIAKHWLNFDVDLRLSALASLATSTLALFFGSVALFWQSFSGSRAKALGVAGGVFAVSYFGLVFSRLIDSLEFLQNFTPFYYLDTNDILLDQINIAHSLVLLPIMFALLILGQILFKRRNVG